jgi:hypothetical protein
VGAAGLDSLPPSDPSSKIAPPGLLAARRIVFEISRRNERDRRVREKRIDAITGSAVDRWQEKWSEVKDLDFVVTPTEFLKKHLVLMSHLLSTAPDAESEDTVRLLAERARSELERRLTGPISDSLSGSIRRAANIRDHRNIPNRN